MNDKEKAIADMLLEDIKSVNAGERPAVIHQYESFLRTVAQRQAIDGTPR